MLKDMRGEEVAEGDVMMFAKAQIPSETILGLTVAVSGPMVKRSPQFGEVISQNVKVLFIVNMEVAKGTALPFPVLDKSSHERAKEFFNELCGMVEKIKATGGGKSGGSIITAE